MTRIFKGNGGLKGVMLLMAFGFSFISRAQYDTLHLYYNNISVTPHDTTLAKMDKWIKSLNGKHQDMKVVGYYHKLEFKKYAQERVDEMFLVINRKARSLFTIEEMVTRKGKDFQRTTVDLIYKPTGGTVAAKEKPVTKEKEASKPEAKGEKEEKTAKAKKEEKSSDKEEKAATSKKEKPSKEEKDGEAKAEKSKKSDKGAEKGSKEKAAKGGEDRGEKGDEKKLSADEKKAQKAKEKEEAEAAAKAEKEREEKFGGPKIKDAGAGTFITGKEVKAIKASKIIVTQQGDELQDKLLLEAVKRYWNFTSDIEVMPYKEARALAKEKENVLVMSYGDVRSKGEKRKGPSLNLGLVQLTVVKQKISWGHSVMIEDGKGKIIATQYIPGYGDDGILTPEVLAFGVSALNYQLKTMSEKDLGSNLKIKGAYKEHSEKLKLKTLYIPESWLDAELPEQKLKALYKAKAEVVSFEKWTDAIIKKEDVAYVILVPTPIGGDFVFIHYLMDAQTGMVYAMCQPKAAISVMGKNASKSNSGYIKEVNVEKYNDAITGDW